MGTRKRKIGFRTYRFHSDYKQKRNAKHVANNFRKAHVGARVLQNGDMWEVWVHEKKWMR